jgi:thiosulfate dehydrogenase [quinone] large subunit
MAGNVLLDWLSIVALLGIGVALILGIGMRVAAVSATALLGFMWMASLPLENHPVIDDHLIYAMVAIGLAAQKAGDTLGLGRAWADLPIVQRLPILR